MKTLYLIDFMKQFVEKYAGVTVQSSKGLMKGVKMFPKYKIEGPICFMRCAPMMEPYFEGYQMHPDGSMEWIINQRPKYEGSVDDLLKDKDATS